MTINGFNAAQYARTSRALSRAIGPIETSAGLPAAMRALEQQQRELGFIRSHSKDIERWQLTHPVDHVRRLSVQFNPHRAARPQVTPVPRGRYVHGCAFCPHELEASQHYREFGYELAVGTGGPWIAWMNPYPLQPTHFCAAPREHEPQEWIADDVKTSQRQLRSLLVVMLSLLKRLPGFFGFHNSPGAGATQPHLHLQLFEQPGYAFALEAAAASTSPSDRAGGTPVAEHHPVPTMYFQGRHDAVIEAAVHWAGAWLDAQRSILPTLAANVIATCDAASGLCDVFIAPRSRLFERASMLAGRVASLEVMGELVLSSVEERELLQSGRLDYERAWSMLAALETPGMRRSTAGADAR